MNAALLIFAAAIVVPVGVIECRRKWRDLMRSVHGHDDYLDFLRGAPGKTGEISPSADASPENVE